MFAIAGHLFPESVDGARKCMKTMCGQSHTQTPHYFLSRATEPREYDQNSGFISMITGGMIPQKLPAGYSYRKTRITVAKNAAPGPGKA